MPRKRKGQAPTAAPDQAYGEAGVQKEAQRAVPMADNTDVMEPPARGNRRPSNDEALRARRDARRQARVEEWRGEGPRPNPRRERRVREWVERGGGGGGDMEAALQAALGMEPPPDGGLLLQPTARPDEALNVMPQQGPSVTPQAQVWQALADQFDDPWFEQLAVQARMKGLQR